MLRSFIFERQQELCRSVMMHTLGTKQLLTFVVGLGSNASDVGKVDGGGAPSKGGRSQTDARLL